MLDAGFTCCFGDFPDICVPWFLVWERIEKKNLSKKVKLPLNFVVNLWTLVIECTSIIRMNQDVFIKESAFYCGSKR